MEENTRLRKHIVCTECLSVGLLYADCVCRYQRDYKTIELEFEMCNCCGNIISDGSPAETEFNAKQLEKLL